MKSKRLSLLLVSLVGFCVIGHEAFAEPDQANEIVFTSEQQAWEHRDPAPAPAPLLEVFPLWLRGASVMPAPAPVVPIAVDVLFFSGYRLSGKLAMMDDALLDVAYDSAGAPLRVKREKVMALYFGAKSNTLPASRLPDSLSFVAGGDLVPCKVHELNANKLIVTTSYAGKMILPREQVSLLCLGSNGMRYLLDESMPLDDSWGTKQFSYPWTELKRYKEYFKDLNQKRGDEPFLALQLPMPSLAKDLGLNPSCFDFSVRLEHPVAEVGDKRARQVFRGSNNALTFVFGGDMESFQEQSRQGNGKTSIMITVREDSVQLILQKSGTDAVLANVELPFGTKVIDISLSVTPAGEDKLNYELQVNKEAPIRVSKIKSVPQGGVFGLFSMGRMDPWNMFALRLGSKTSALLGEDLLAKNQYGLLTQEQDFLPFAVETLVGSPLVATVKDDKGQQQRIPEQYIAQVMVNPMQASSTADEKRSSVLLGDGSCLEGVVRGISGGNLHVAHPYLGEIAIPLKHINRVALSQQGVNPVKSKP